MSAPVPQYLRVCNVRLALARFAICFTFSLLAAPGEDAIASPEIKPSPGDDLFAKESVLRIRVEMRPQELRSLRDESRKYVCSTFSAEGRVYREVGTGPGSAQRHHSASKTRVNALMAPQCARDT